MHTWHWRTWEGLPYLTCSLLEPWQHGFFTSSFAPRLPGELVAVLHSEAEVYRLQQVHGNRVLTPSERQDGDRSPGDGMITEQPLQSVWVASADCTPVLLADAETGRVAAIHAGWRGTAAQIVPEAIARFLSLGSKVEDLRLAMGPAIAGEVYQVTEAVAAEVGASIIPSDSSEVILEAMSRLPNPPILDDPKPERVLLDVRRVNQLQLEQLGLDPEQVAIASHCTYQEPEYFFSYRRDKLKKVQWSGIVSR